MKVCDLTRSVEEAAERIKGELAEELQRIKGEFGRVCDGSWNRLRRQTEELEMRNPRSCVDAGKGAVRKQISGKRSGFQPFVIGKDRTLRGKNRQRLLFQKWRVSIPPGSRYNDNFLRPNPFVKLFV
jgi:hypothetical protein